MRKNELIVKSFEEECGAEYMLVTFPITLEKETAMNWLKGIEKYLTTDFLVEATEKDASQYDYQFEEIFPLLKKSSQMQELFINIITDVFGWKIEFLKEDYYFEW